MRGIPRRTIRRFVRNVVEYYQERGQSYPWRSEDADPYEILIAEVFLTRTGRRQAEEVFERFVSRFPDLQSLSGAEREEVERIVRPLGLRRRAESIRELGRMIEEDFDGEIPSDGRIFELPGIGPYHGNMILCLGFGKSTAPVDTNIARILNRVFGLNREKTPGRLSRDEEIRKTAEKCSPSDMCAEYNLGLLDLGDEICKARNPNCEGCPVGSICEWRRTRKQTGR